MEGGLRGTTLEGEKGKVELLWVKKQEIFGSTLDRHSPYKSTKRKKYSIG